MTLIFALAIALVSGLAALYLWVFASQLHTPLLGWLQRWLRTGWRVPLVSCPWCFGFWASMLIAIVLGAVSGTHIVVTLASGLAGAAVAGFIGSLTPGFSPPEE